MNRINKVFIPTESAEDWKALLAKPDKIPDDERYHVETRTEAYLIMPYFEVLESHGVGQVLSHWTWLPPLCTQFARSGGRFLNSDNQLIIRLMTPLRVRYEESTNLSIPTPIFRRKSTFKL